MLPPFLYTFAPDDGPYASKQVVFYVRKSLYDKSCCVYCFTLCYLICDRTGCHLLRIDI